MFDKDQNHVCRLFILLTGTLFALSFPLASRSQGTSADETLDSLKWESKSRLHGVFRSTRGDLFVNGNGVEFRPLNGLPLRLSFGDQGVTDLKSVRIADIKSLRIAPKRLVLVSYENRRWHRGGDREFRFDLDSAVPIEVAADLIKRVGKPSINGLPDPQAPALAMIAARRRTLAGGSNGVLRFRAVGIDYVASSSDDSRSWRWTDIETIANPDPYHFRVGGYLETFEFELKQPMPSQLFDRLWRDLYAQDLNINASANDPNRSLTAATSRQEEQR